MPLTIRQLAAQLPPPGQRPYSTVEALVDLARLEQAHVEMSVRALARRWTRSRSWVTSVVAQFAPSAAGAAPPLPIDHWQPPNGLDLKGISDQASPPETTPADPAETRTDPKSWAPMLRSRAGSLARAESFIRWHLPKIESEADEHCEKQGLPSDGAAWRKHVRTRLWAYANHEWSRPPTSPERPAGGDLERRAEKNRDAQTRLQLQSPEGQEMIERARATARASGLLK